MSDPASGSASGPGSEPGSAADEHALLQEITAPFETLPLDPVPIAADVEFPVVLRGYDRLEVDQYVKRTTQLVTELHATRSPEAAVRRAIERVGEQVSGILQRAHESAEQITGRSRSEAEDRLERARREAAQIRAGAEQRLTDLDADTDRIWAERHRIIDDTRKLARQLLGLADAAAERFPPAEEASAEEAPAERGEERRPEGVEEGEATVAMPPGSPPGDTPASPPQDGPVLPGEDGFPLPGEQGTTAR
jgi:cell division septum initiation protein DivIVA